MSNQQSLDDLLLDESSFNEAVLTETVSPYMRIGDSSGAFVPTDEFDELNAKQQVATVLLTRKAAFEKGLAETEDASPKEIADMSGINHNTVKPKVRELDDEGLVDNDDGRYSVPPYNFEKIGDLLEAD